MRFLPVLLACLALSGCIEVAGPGPSTRSAPAQSASPGTSVAVFQSVVRQVEPVAETFCRRRTQGQNCDFRIVVDDRPGQPPNAFQTLDDNGRPVIGFTAALIRNARNADELAFVLGHEAAHHIRGHIPQTQTNAALGGIAGNVLGGVIGLDPDTAGRLGATLGARRFAKDFELEADSLGTVIAFRAGFDPVRGAEYFARIPDPGNQFLGTHPPNADRIATVRRVAADL